MFNLARSLVLLSLDGAFFALLACAPSAEPVDRPPPPPSEARPDAGALVEDGPDAGTPACALDLPPLRVREGGRLTVTLDPRIASSLDGVVASGGLESVGEESGLEFWASYGEVEGWITFERSECPPVTAAVSIEPMDWALVSAWGPGALEGPPAREYGASSIVELGDRRGILIVGGFHYEPAQFTPSKDVWFFDLLARTWTELPDAGAPLGAGSRIADGQEAGTRLLFGGATLANDGSLTTPRRLQIIRFGEEALSWEDAPFEAQAPGSYTGSIVYDRKRDRWLSVCGVDAMTLGVHCQVFEYTVTAGWRPLEAIDESPPGRFGFHYAYDEDDDRIIIAAGQSAGAAVLGDTWALELQDDPPRWVRLFEQDPQVARRNGAFVFDPVGQRLILWGGTADGRTAVPGISVLRLGRGAERWDHRDAPSTVPARASGFAVYDATGRQALMGMGNEGPRYTDLYSLSL